MFLKPRSEWTPEFTAAWDAETARLLAASKADLDTVHPDGTCTGCGHPDEDELRPDANGDLYCGDCRTTYSEHDDAAERRAYAYH